MSKLSPGSEPGAVPAFPSAAHRFNNGRRPAALLTAVVIGAAIAYVVRRTHERRAATRPEPSAGVDRVTVTLPYGFNPTRHMRTLARAVTELNGPGWKVIAISRDRRTATVERRLG